METNNKKLLNKIIKKYQLISIVEKYKNIDELIADIGPETYTDILYSLAKDKEDSEESEEENKVKNKLENKYNTLNMKLKKEIGKFYKDEFTEDDFSNNDYQNVIDRLRQNETMEEFIRNLYSEGKFDVLIILLEPRLYDSDFTRYGVSPLAVLVPLLTTGGTVAAGAITAAIPVLTSLAKKSAPILIKFIKDNIFNKEMMSKLIDLAIKYNIFELIRIFTKNRDIKEKLDPRELRRIEKFVERKADTLDDIEDDIE